MRGIAVLLVAFAFASTAFLAEPASAQSGTSLSGQVCIQSPYSSQPGCSGGQALPGATVTASRAGTLPAPAPAPAGPTQVQATTDANGYYTFTGLTAGTYTVSVTRTGFQSASAEVQVASGANRHDAALVGDSVTAQGRVSNPESAAISGASINFCCINGYFSAQTGTDGRYSVAVQAGYWSIDLSAPGFQSSYHQMLVDGSAIDFVLQPIPPQDGRLTGVVRDQDGQPVADARISLANYGGCCYAYAEDQAMGSSTSASPQPYYYAGENSTTTDAQGRFSIGAYSGQNQLSIYKDGYASQSRTVTIASGAATTQDIELLKFPEKTAKITGKIVDAQTGKGLSYAYLSVNSPAYGIHECSARGNGSNGSSGTTSSGEAKMIAPGDYYPYSGCAITLHDDGTFEGMITPGYAILSVYVDSYAMCSENRDADGSTSRSCGPEYYGWSLSRDLAADATTNLDIRMRARPAADAVVSGYIIDAESGKAIAGAQISFSNQDNYGYGYATTDSDGSYKLRLRSGYHAVSVWAEGHLRWEGTVDIAKGDTPFDVKVVPGQESYGYYCCPGPYYGREEVAYPTAAGDAGKSSGSSTATGAPSNDLADGSSQSSASQYEDLGGGLGPYNAAQRDSQLQQSSDGSPGFGLVALLAAVGAVLLLRRRMA